MNTRNHNTSMDAENMVCINHPDTFQHPALDYDPRDGNYADLDAEERAKMRATKAKVERAAKRVCFSCSARTACAAKYATLAVSGVVGGQTANERRRNRPDGRRPVRNDTAMIEHLITGRGNRRSIDAAAVAVMTAEGKSAEEIGYHFHCNPRTVVRARNRARTLALVSAGMAAPATAQTITNVTTLAITTADVTFGVAAATLAINDAYLTSSANPLTPLAFPNPAVTDNTLGAHRAPAIRLSATSAPMIAILTALQDGNWHHENTLITLGAAHVHTREALNWWYRTNSAPTPTGRALKPGRENTPAADRVERGARSKVANMLSASARTRHQTERNHTHEYRFTPAGTAAWTAANTVDTVNTVDTANTNAA